MRVWFYESFFFIDHRKLYFTVITDFPLLALNCDNRNRGESMVLRELLKCIYIAMVIYAFFTIYLYEMSIVLCQCH